MNSVPNYTSQDHLTWTKLFNEQARLRDQQLVPEFSHGLKVLGIDGVKIPNIDEVNKRLLAVSGWQGVYTEGFVAAKDFFKMLSEKKFPIGNFIRDAKDLSYTPAPDVFHDLYGHIPFYTNLAYADFSQRFGKAALDFLQRPDAIEAFQRLFWFTVEFALIKTTSGPRIFGAGIASSISECEYALSNRPRIHPFDIRKIRHQNFRIDVIQDDLFLLDSEDQLYGCISEFVKLLQSEGS